MTSIVAAPTVPYEIRNHSDPIADHKKEFLNDIYFTKHNHTRTRDKKGWKARVAMIAMAFRRELPRMIVRKNGFGGAMQPRVARRRDKPITLHRKVKACARSYMSSVFTHSPYEADPESNLDFPSGVRYCKRCQRMKIVPHANEHIGS